MTHRPFGSRGPGQLSLKQGAQMSSASALARGRSPKMIAIAIARVQWQLGQLDRAARPLLQLALSLPLSYVTGRSQPGRTWVPAPDLLTVQLERGARQVNSFLWCRLVRRPWRGFAWARE